MVDGTANPTAFLLCMRDSNGDIYVVEEYFHSCRNSDEEEVKPELQKTDIEYAEDMRKFLYEMSGYTGLSYKNIEICIDPAAASFKLQLRRMHMKAKNGDNDVLSGIRTVASLFSSQKLFISQNCENLIKELHTYSWDTKAQARGWKNLAVLYGDI